MAEIKELSEKNFEGFISEGAVLVDFFASWCMPCITMGPVVEDVAGKFEGKVKFGKVDVDENKGLSEKFEVRSIPCFILFKDGKLVEQFFGVVSAEDFEKRLKGFVDM